MEFLTAIGGARDAASAKAEVYRAKSCDNSEFDVFNLAKAVAQSMPSYIPDPMTHLTLNRTLLHPGNRPRAAVSDPNIRKKGPNKRYARHYGAEIAIDACNH